MSDTSLTDLLDGFNQDLLNKLELGRKAAKHPVKKGDVTEGSWLQMFQNYLPERYQADTGFVVDTGGEISEQIDIIIFDRQYTPFIFVMNGLKYLPAESVYAVFEVKQTLNKKHLEYAQKKVSSVRRLYRTSLPVPNIYGTSKPKDPPYIHSGLLCFQSTWRPCFGQAFEKVMSGGKGNSQINVICAADQGVFEIDDNCQTMKITDRAVTYFFFRIVSILQQKATVPMIDLMAYASWLEKVK